MRHCLTIAMIFVGITCQTSCIKDVVTVYYNTHFCGENDVMIDGKLELRRDIFRRYKKINLHEGEHYYQINDGPKLKFIVDPKGGIFNFAEEEFVVYPVYYINDQPAKMTPLGKPNLIRVDQFVVGSESYFPNFTHNINRKHAETLTDGDIESQLQVKRKSAIFIPKTWDLDMRFDDKEVENELSNYVIEPIVARRRVMEAKDFLIKMAKKNSPFQMVKFDDLK